MQDELRHKNFLYVLSFCTSFNSFLIFAIICKQFAEITGMEVISQISLTTMFIFCLGISALALEKYKGEKLKIFLKAEIILSIFILAVPFLLDTFLVFYHLPGITKFIWPIFMILLVVPLGILTGIELPSYLSLSPKLENKFLFLNYSGSLIASFIIVYYYKLGLDFYALCCAVGGFNFLAASSIDSLLIRRSKTRKMISLVVFLFFFTSAVMMSPIKETFKKMSYLDHYVYDFESLKNLYYKAERGSEIVSIKTPFQNIDIIPSTLFNPQLEDSRWGLFLNHKIQFYSDTEKIYHQTMSFYPIIVTGKVPQNILILGGGDLGLARELSRLKTEYPKISITVVELDEKMLELAKNGPLLNKMNTYEEIKDKILIINDDAINFLRNNKIDYDFILADFPFPTSFELGKLYTKEFYKLVSKNLSEDGLFILDFPFLPNSTENEKEVASILINTLKKSGFNYQLIFGVSETFILNSRFKFTPKSNYFLVEKYIENYVLTNLIERTDEYTKDLKETEIVHSIFKPAMEFKLDKR